MKFQEIFRIITRNDDIDAARACKRYERMKRRLPFFSIISYWAFKKFTFKYIETFFYEIP